MAAENAREIRQTDRVENTEAQTLFLLGLMLMLSFPDLKSMKLIYLKRK